MFRAIVGSGRAVVRIQDKDSNRGLGIKMLPGPA